MSRVGKLPVEVPAGVTVGINGVAVSVSGPMGKLDRVFNNRVSIALEDNKRVQINPVDDSSEARAMWGTARSVISNMVTGVHKGYTRKLDIQGVGFRAAYDGKSILTLTVGYSHEIKYVVPAGVKVACEKPTAISITGSDKQLVGQVAAEIRGFRKPEPYKGKGIRYEGERIRMKEGKKK